MPIKVFTAAVKNLLATINPANTGKTFLLNPLNIVYKSFTYPPTVTFAWVGAEMTGNFLIN